jgi:hypothetical protein
MTKHCANISQLRLRPSNLVIKGSESRSTKGAHIHLKPYTNPTQLRKPIVLRSIPASRKRKLKVPNTSNNGRPAENPKNSMRQEAGSK